MKKNIYSIITLMAIALLLSACGNDDPIIPRDRDVTMTVEALTHISDISTGEAQIVMGNANTFTFHPKTLTLDIQLNATIDGTARTFSITGVPVKAVTDTYRYTFDTATTGNSEVTNLKGTIDISDPLAIAQCDVSGHHICITVPEIFFHQTAVYFSYSDGSKSSYGNSYWTLPIDSKGSTTGVSINNIEIANDLMSSGNESKRSGRFFSAIMAYGAKVEATATGVKITADELNTVATYGNGEEVAAAYQTDNYPIMNLNADINLNAGTMTATFTLRHVLDRDNMKHPSQWDDISVTASGTIFRQSIFE